MARVRLKVYTWGHARPATAGLGVTALPLFRVYAAVSLGPIAGPVRAVVDTGAAVTVFPPAAWQQDNGKGEAIDAVELFPEPLVLPTLNAGGWRYTYRWGRVEMTLHDADDPAITLPPVPVVGQFCVERLLTDAERSLPASQHRPDLPHVLLGLSAGVFDGRHVVLKTGRIEAECAAWVQDGPPGGG